MSILNGLPQVKEVLTGDIVEIPQFEEGKKVRCRMSDTTASMLELSRDGNDQIMFSTYNGDLLLINVTGMNVPNVQKISVNPSDLSFAKKAEVEKVINYFGSGEFTAVKYESDEAKAVKLILNPSQSSVMEDSDVNY